MTRTMFPSLKVSMMGLAIVIMLQYNVIAGPPLICHPFDIGDAKSLPWEPSSNYNSPKANYDIANLVADTLSLLGRDVPVIVRMETLRRAGLYAQQDQQIAMKLLDALIGRAREDEGKGKADALSFFDFGYLLETCKQANLIYKKITDQAWERIIKQNPATGLDGYAWVSKAISLRRNDPAMEFAAALILSDRKHAKERQEHLHKAVVDASEGSLLAKNLVSHFGNRGGTFAELRVQYGKNQ